MARLSRREVSSLNEIATIHLMARTVTAGIHTVQLSASGGGGVNDPLLVGGSGDLGDGRTPEQAIADMGSKYDALDRATPVTDTKNDGYWHRV